MSSPGDVIRREHFRNSAFKGQVGTCVRKCRQSCATIGLQGGLQGEGLHAFTSTSHTLTPPTFHPPGRHWAVTTKTKENQVERQLYEGIELAMFIFQINA